ncbi:hydrolase [Paenibacillus sp. J31TS4]|uniref:SGNH/GDSL hydrolase family protein n=1 Tax=Paenibacillus sp. J31TS4 TaxID=2807195 RepID=UPI001B079A63|nr:SGNH/GDSL hydrolase family protein [Paenibacillus sp. J31TS4]GIP38832.1 hydrolase [Paenibacillus sp. J31TS4]
MSEQPTFMARTGQESEGILKETDTEALMWLSPFDPPIQIAGFGWLKQEGRYRRLPAAPTHPLPPAVDALADNTAGGQLRFRTDALQLSVRVKLAAPGDMYHMPSTGQCGFDLYIGEPGEQRYYGTTRLGFGVKEYESLLFSQPTPQMRSVTINFPLYQGVEEVLVGFSPDAVVEAPPAYESDKRVIVYGTSITQGGCATRPGMAWSNIISRRIPYEFLNLGFSGNGKGEPELAHIISQIERPGLFVLDYESNAGLTFKDTLPGFVRILRDAHPEVPILVVSKIRYAKESFDDTFIRNRLANSTFARQFIDEHRRQGDRHLHFLDGSTFLGDDFDECTVDGVHPTDLGFLRMADALTPVIRQLLQQAD